MGSAAPARCGRLATPVRAGLLASIVALAGCGAAPPNVVLVSLDTVRADHLPFHGYPRDTMPALSAFAARGAIFDQAFAQAPSTVPTHASLFTGRFAYQHRTYGYPQALPDAERTLAEFFAERGYRTFAVASSIRFIESAGFAQGFDFYRSLHDLDKVERSAELTKLAVEQAGADASRPYFAFLHYFDAHSPYAPPPRYRTLWHPGLPEPAPEDTTEWLREHRDRSQQVDAETIAYLVGLYDASLRFLDDALAELFATLPDNGRPTLWVITSDHGEEFKEHDGFLHSRTLFQELLHVPLVVVYPDRIAPGTRIGRPAQSVDVFPTIAELAAGTRPDSLPGRSFAPQLGGDPPAAAPDRERDRDWIVVERAGMLGVVATLPQGRFKWIDEPPALYALDADPGETRDLASEEPAIVRYLSDVPERLGIPPVEERSSAFLRAQSEQAEGDDAVADRLRALGYVEEVGAGDSPADIGTADAASDGGTANRK